MTGTASARPELLVFDVNETLSDMSPLRERFVGLGVAEETAATWFATVLRDGFALSSVGESAPFAEIAAQALRTLVPGVTEDDVSAVLGTFTGLEVHPDVVEGVRSLAAQGIELVTLSNGAASVAEALLERAGLRQHFSRLLSVDDAGIWKPSQASYHYALDVCGVSAERAMLVAVHPWDTHGAHRAGLRAAYVDRVGAGYPAYFSAPDMTVSSLAGLPLAWP